MNVTSVTIKQANGHNAAICGAAPYEALAFVANELFGRDGFGVIRGRLYATAELLEARGDKTLADVCRDAMHLFYELDGSPGRDKP